MPFTQDMLTQFLRERAQERWETDHQPYLLSLVATELREKGKDYREAIGEERLKTFVKRMAEASGYAVVEHSTQRAKVGVIPAGETFAFEQPEGDLTGPPSKGRERVGSENERVVLAFLRALARLPEPLLDEVNIPAKVLVKLLARK